MKICLLFYEPACHFTGPRVVEICWYSDLALVNLSNPKNPFVILPDK